MKLASLFNTNTKYAYKIIAKYRNKGIIEYITDLKIDHIIELLKNETKYRIYKNKSLADEDGFGSTQNFTRAFKTQTGISPSCFCMELNKSLTADILNNCKENLNNSIASSVRTVVSAFRIKLRLCLIFKFLYC
ncbi:helix-turn-helix domain-containing protein [Flavobacterium pygoscelis]|uniref:helix-turn-helix domain-containing protein n=1 Tax=Flavobacterium pygoscelis TaxID=2893176 RepID=UPI0020BE0ECA|nr:helix-turn-helix domain-containing protein [Flavobacterium pygoscelis]